MSNIKTAGILLLAAIIAALIGGSGFIGWPLNASEMDYLLFPKILENRALFEGTVYLPLAEQTSKLSILPWLSGILAEWGLSSTQQVTFFFTVEKFFYSIGLLSICYLLSRNILTTIVCFFIFMVSGSSSIFDLKLITSSLAISIGFCLIALALAGRFQLAGALAAGIGYLHPTYMMVYFSLVLIIQAYAVWRDKTVSLTTIWKTVIIALAIGAPLAVNIADHADSVFGRIDDTNLWFSYMQNRSDLAFPWRHGLPRLMAFVLTFAITAWLFLNEAKAKGKDMFGRVAMIVLAGIASYPIQIIFTEVAPVVFIAKLALTHRFNFIVQPLLIIGILLTAYNGMKGEQRWSWALLILFLMTNLLFPQGSIASKYLPNAHDMGLNLLVLTLVATYLKVSSGSSRDEYSPSRHLLAGRAALLLAFFSLVVFVNPSFMLPLCSVLIAMSWNKPSIWKHLETKLEKVSPRACHTSLLVMLSLLLLFKMNLLGPMRAWSALLQSNTRALNIREKQYIDFVVTHVKEDERILIVPLRESGKWVPVPYRASYLDWYEINYVLYVWDMMPALIEKVQSYGIDLFAAQAKNECAGWKSLLQYRCQRSVLDRNARDEEYGWRLHVDEILRIDPKVRWAFMPKKLSCEKDRIVTRFEENVLVDVHQIDPSCGPERAGRQELMDNLL